MNCIVTGGTGFIGLKLCESLLKLGHNVTIIDRNKSRMDIVIKKYSSDFKFFNMNVLDCKDYIFDHKDCIFHFAANPIVDIKTQDYRSYFYDNVYSTYKILEMCKIKKIKRFIFASTSAIYGNAKTLPTPENYKPISPESIYAVSKLSSELMIKAFSERFNIKCLVLRLANIIGETSDHGVIFDFIEKLNKNPSKIEILGNGKQKKSYLYIEDAIGFIIKLFENDKYNFEIYNIGSDDQITVKEIADIVKNSMGLSPKYVYTGEKIGWKGDVPIMLLDIKKLNSAGLYPKYNSKESVKKTVINIINNKFHTNIDI